MKNIIFMSVLAIAMSHSPSFASHHYDEEKHYCTHFQRICPDGYICKFTSWNTNQIFECVKHTKPIDTYGDCVSDSDCPEGYKCKYQWTGGYCFKQNP